VETYVGDGQDYTDIAAQLAENLYIEDPAAWFKKCKGPVYGHHLPNGDWKYHKITSKQGSTCREEMRNLITTAMSLEELALGISKMIKKPQRELY
jgi:hypothetical protein